MKEAQEFCLGVPDVNFCQEHYLNMEDGIS